MLSRVPILGSVLAPKPSVTVATAAFSTTSVQNWRDRPTDEQNPDRCKLYRVVLHNKRHLREHKKLLMTRFEKPNGFPGMRVHKYGTRGIGIRHHGRWEVIPEKIPQLVVPDLSECYLKPYVSYKTKDIYQEELNAKDLFNAIYGPKIFKDYKEGKLDEAGNPAEPSENEKLTPEVAKMKARRTGADIFEGGLKRDKKWNVRWSYE